jgi:hypothetical protein
MRAAIEVIWWLGLVGALVPTLVIVKEALLVIGTLRRILGLAESIWVAAKGIVVHLQAVPNLEGVATIVEQLDRDVGKATDALEDVARRVRRAAA